MRPRRGEALKSAEQRAPCRPSSRPEQGVLHVAPQRSQFSVPGTSTLHTIYHLLHSVHSEHTVGHFDAGTVLYLRCLEYRRLHHIAVCSTLTLLLLY